jgi:hypothetical protein
VKIHKSIALQEDIRLVISSHVYGQFSSDDIESAVGAVGYAAKQHLRLSESVSGEGTILGNVMILDLHIPLSSSNSRDYSAYVGDFYAAVEEYLEDGIVHKGSGTRLGDFGKVSISWVSKTPIRKVTLEIYTDKTDEEILDLARAYGNVRIV